jgi:hypothetical protein
MVMGRGSKKIVRVGGFRAESERVSFIFFLLA